MIKALALSHELRWGECFFMLLLRFWLVSLLWSGRSLHFVRFLSGAGFPEACFSFDGCDFVGGASDAGALEDLELAAD